MACLLVQVIPFSAAGGLSLSVTVVHGEVMVTCHLWVHHLVRGSIPRDLDLEALLAGVLSAAVVCRATQTTMSLCPLER